MELKTNSRIAFFSTCGGKYIAVCDNVLYRVEE